MKTNRETETTNNILQGLDKADFVTSSFSRSLSIINTLTNNFIILKDILSVIPFISEIIVFYTCMLAAINAAFIQEQHLATRIVQVTCYLAIIAAVTTALVISSPAIPFIATGILAFNRIWNTGVAIFNRLTSTSTDVNQTKQLNGAIAERAHMVGVSVVTFAGLVTSLFIPPVGIAILLAVSTYMVADKFGFNPLRALGNKIFNSPFVTDEVVAPAKPIVSSTTKIMASKRFIPAVTLAPSLATTTKTESIAPVKRKAIVMPSVSIARLGTKFSHLPERPKTTSSQSTFGLSR